VFFGRRPKADPAQAARQLRDSAISMKVAELGLSPSADLPHVWGIMMEAWQSKAVVSLAVFAEGTTSLYFSTGGGVLGAGKRENVRTASRAFLASAEPSLARLSSATTTPLPATGAVRFYVHTFEGLLTAEVEEQELSRGRHPLSALFQAGQAVITEIRLSTGEAALSQAGLSTGMAATQRGGAEQQADAKRHVESLASGIETLRRLTTQRTTYRPPEPHDSVPAAAQEALAAGERDLKEQGMTLLGDRMELQEDGTAVGPGRWFIDKSGTICGRFSAVLSKGTGTITPLVMLFSEASSGEFFLTGRGSAGVSLAKQPNLVREYVKWNDGLGRTLERHRAATARAAKAGELRRIEGIDEALDLLARLRKSGSDWRKIQDADVLLDLDVRSVLGNRYDELGRQVMDVLKHGRT
jgi:hypothetical protein